MQSSSALDASVLVLNKLFMAIHIISVRRAFVLLCKDLAEVVSLEEGQFATYDFETWRELSEFRSKYFRQEDDDWVRTATSEIQVPRVVRLLSYEKLPRQTVKFNRRNIFARDHNQCQYCGKKYPTTELSLDHIVPRSQGGMSTWENIVCSCINCNDERMSLSFVGTALGIHFRQMFPFQLGLVPPGITALCDRHYSG